MSEFFFGLGRGHLPAKARNVARKNGAILVNYTDPGCRCGFGCTSGECKACKRHWFEVPNFGEPHNSRAAEKVVSALKLAGVKMD